MHPCTGLHSPMEHGYQRNRQQLVILKWPVDNEHVEVLLQPGI
jgi:hypothetical protein